jgi:hypothetical protein
MMVTPLCLGAQWSAPQRGSDNIEVVAHVPLGGDSVADIEIEQDLDRPYAYVSRDAFEGNTRGMDIIDLRDPENAAVLYRWRIKDSDLHIGGGLDVKLFEWNDRHYVVQSFQFSQGGPNADLGAIIFDVTDLPDVASVREVGRIRVPDHPSGFHNIFVYQHTNGRVLLFTTASAPEAFVFDLGYIIDGAGGEGGIDALVARIPAGAPGDIGPRGYHDMYVGFHPDTQQDRFYGGGTGGYYVYDVTDLENPTLAFSLTGIPGVQYGHTFTPSPDGRYAIAETEYRYAPLRIFDLQPALDGETKNISQPISAWTADWRHLVHNHEVRWPFVFVSGYVDGLQVFSLADPKNPQTVAWYDTYLPEVGSDDARLEWGAFGVDVRNADGLIVVSDAYSGFWAFRMEGFSGWNGNDWGMPDISSVQKWGQR